MKIFVSSLIGGMEDIRAAAERAIRSLGHEPVRAEEFQASPQSPQIACLAALRDSDAVVLILGERYGAKQASGISATHEEFNEARESRPVFAFIASGGSSEPDQQTFIREVQDWQSGHFTGFFKDTDDLNRGVTVALHRWEISRVAGAPSPDEMLSRATAMLPPERSGYSSGTATLRLALVGAPRQQILRPSDIESDDLRQKLHQAALFGSAPIFLPEEGATPGLHDHTLSLRQKHAALSIDEQGSILIELPLTEARGGFPAIIEEEVLLSITRGLRFATQTLDMVDSEERISHVAFALRLDEASYRGWRTRAEQDRNPTSGTMSMGSGGNAVPVSLSPPHRTRSALRQQSDALAQDLMVLLRRKFRK